LALAPVAGQILRQSLADQMPNPGKYLKRLEHWWHRDSEWPK